jgi:hypothetical protein
MAVGTVAHAVICEDKSLEELVAEYPDDCYTQAEIPTLHAVRAARFREENAGRVVLKHTEAQKLRECIETILGHSVILSLRSAKIKEQRYDAVVCDVRCRARPDIVLEDELVDLKFGECIDPVSFARLAKNLRYWLQDAHYSAVVGTRSFRFIAVETERPYRVQEYWYSEESRAAARRWHANKLAELRRAYDTGDWSDRWCSEITAWIPESNEIWLG